MRLLRVSAKMLVIGLLVAPVAAESDPSVGFPQTIGPYVQMVGTDHAFVHWAELRGLVKSGSSLENSDLTEPIYAHRKHYVQATKSVMAGRRDVPYELPGIGSGKFRLAPRSQDSTFSFAVFGDNKSWHTNGEGSDKHYTKLISRLRERKPEFVVNTGDLVFEGRDYRDWIPFFRISGNLMRHVPYFPVVGNHEESANPLFKFFHFPDGQSYYSFNWGQLHFIVLNSCGQEALVERRERPQTEWKNFLATFQDSVERPFFQEQLEWLKQDLESHKDFPFIMVSFHYPVFNTLPREHENADVIRDDWVPLLEEYRVSAVFNWTQPSLSPCKKEWCALHDYCGRWGKPLSACRAAIR